jgi:hypothetical protein
MAAALVRVFPGGIAWKARSPPGAEAALNG